MNIAYKSKFTMEYAPPELSSERVGLIERSYDSLFDNIQKSIRKHLSFISDTEVSKYLKYHRDTANRRITYPVTSLSFKKELSSQDIKSLSETFDRRLNLTKSLAYERLQAIRDDKDMSDERKKDRESSVLSDIFSEMAKPVIDQIEKRTEVPPSKPLAWIIHETHSVTCC